MEACQSTYRVEQSSAIVFMLCTGGPTSGGLMLTPSGQSDGPMLELAGSGYHSMVVLASALDVSLSHTMSTTELQLTSSEQLALAEVAYTTVRMLQHFERITPCGSPIWREHLTLTCSVEGGVNVILRERRKKGRFVQEDRCRWI